MRPARFEDLGEQFQRVRLVVDRQDVYAAEIGQLAWRERRLVPRVHTLLVLALVDDPHRQSDPERRARSTAGTGRTDRSAMHFDEVTRDRKAEAEPGVFACDAAVGLTEPVEDMRKKLGFDADARIADSEFDARVDAFQPDLDLALF